MLVGQGSDVLDKPELREATIDDSRAIASLIRRSFRQQVDLLKLRPSECPEYVGFETASRVRRRMQVGNHVLVATLAGKPIGTVAFGQVLRDSLRGEITRLAVLPSHRGIGLGRILMGAAEASLARAGAKIAQISIVAKFDSLRLYYESLGYTKTKLLRFDALPFDVLFMEKRFPEESHGFGAA